MKTPKDWEDQAKGLLKAELKRRNVSYAQLVDKLAEIGVMDSEPNVRNKLSLSLIHISEPTRPY